MNALDQLDATAGEPPSTNEPVGKIEIDEPPVTGRQRGAKNYSLPELTLLNKCMAFATPIGPQGVTEAITLYNRAAKEKGWVPRGDKALRQKWDKVSRVPTPNFIGGSPLRSSRPPSPNLERTT